MNTNVKGIYMDGIKVEDKKREGKNKLQGLLKNHGWEKQAEKNALKFEGLAFANKALNFIIFIL